MPTPQILLPSDLNLDSFETRKELRKTLLGFSLTYLTGYFTDPPATFHPELFKALEDPSLKRLLIIGFRGSGKSTDGDLALALWAALEQPELYPFIIICSDSSRQATLSISAIKHELEDNLLLRQDYGAIKGKIVEDITLRGEDEEWQKQNLVLSNGVRILARSRGQKVRGLRHLQYRPRLFIGDDVEDTEWVRTKENRDKTERWLRSEVLPGLDNRKGRLVLIGNLLHMDALLPRLKVAGSGFKVLEFPLIDAQGKCTWPAMYPTEQSLKDKERDMGPVAWKREMLLQIVADEDQIIKPEDIHYYDEKPKNAVAAIKGHGIDLAISQKESADYTTIVTGEVFYENNAPHIYIRPNPYNAHVVFNDFMTKVRGIPAELKGANLFFVEDVAYQKAAIQEMERRMLPVVPIRPTTDKRSRLQVVAPLIKNGTVLFPRTGCEELLGQLFNLGVESHDDLCLDGETLVLTDRGEVPIRLIQVGDRVMTRQGLKRVLWSGQTGVQDVISRFGITGTPAHSVITTAGVIHLADVIASHRVYMWNRSSSSIEERPIGATRMQNSAPTGSITGAMTGGKRHLTRFTAKCGLMLTARFRAAWSSITRTATHFTTSLRTLSLSVLASTCPTICANRLASSNRAATCSPSFTMPHANGTDHRKAGSGTASTPSVLPPTESSERAFANGAASSTSTPTAPRAFVPTPATAASTRKRPVYNLLVEDAHEFFANGILVHNCDGLTTLLQGLSEQGLELPRIQWIEA